ncbi:hypothetical protein ACYCEU_08035 [Actinotignum timonense]|uniref:Uncharacterized protein n=1 Tax=Actinotignum timonense TaxID=1870995 RepID=A0AAW9HKV2_9ACTO|nr:hypothetical protein [Actinotignum timonense]MDK6591080.1 hypothetical protein [Actinotignum timonense]MDK6629249.1 hypothetical protein [Actinotignum timonense]MDY5141445.1 hypothetical protein [Actinotignum timonense]
MPLLPMDQEWSDEILYQRYALDQDEITLIESMVRPMGGDE